MISKGKLPKTALNLLVDNPKCCNFYMSPKIHKVGNPGRPVLSSCSCLTTLISKYLSDLLKPIVINLESFVKDNNHALKLMKNFSFQEKNAFLFIMDVRGLYTNIPNDYELYPMKYF